MSAITTNVQTIAQGVLAIGGGGGTAWVLYRAARKFQDDYVATGSKRNAANEAKIAELEEEVARLRAKADKCLKVALTARLDRVELVRIIERTSGVEVPVAIRRRMTADEGET